MLKINTIKITGIGPIKNLELSFDNHFNIICGQNGIGKTRILEAINAVFCGDFDFLTNLDFETFTIFFDNQDSCGQLALPIKTALTHFMPPPIFSLARIT